MIASRGQNLDFSIEPGGSILHFQQSLLFGSNTIKVTGNPIG